MSIVVLMLVALLVGIAVGATRVSRTIFRHSDAASAGHYTSWVICENRYVLLPGEEFDRLRRQDASIKACPKWLCGVEPSAGYDRTGVAIFGTCPGDRVHDRTMKVMRLTAGLSEGVLERLADRTNEEEFMRQYLNQPVEFVDDQPIEGPPPGRGAP